MNHHTPGRRVRRMWTAEQDDALARLAAEARLAADAPAAEAKQRIQLAVDAARNVGVGWTRIGDALGMAGGNAYQKYRKKRPPQECVGRTVD